MPVRVVALALMVVGCAGSTTAGQDAVRGAERDAAPVEESLLPAVAGVELRIAVRPDVWSLATTPRVEIEVVNHSGRDIVMMPPQDGSWWGMRDPDYHLEFLDERGAIVPAAVGQQGGCGRLEGYRVERLVTIAAGGRVSLHDAPEAHPYPFSPNVSAHPGRHRVRLRYRADVPGGTPMELVSNTVDVTIAGGDLALWSCYNGPTRVPPPYDWMSHAPHQAIPFADGFVVLDRRERVHGAQGRWRRWGAWWLYRVDGDGELRGDPLPLRGAVGHGDVQLLAIDDAVWLVAGAGQVLEAMQVGSQGGTLTLGAPVVWARDVLDPHGPQQLEAGPPERRVVGPRADEDRRVERAHEGPGLALRQTGPDELRRAPQPAEQPGDVTGEVAEHVLDRRRVDREGREGRRHRVRPQQVREADPELAAQRVEQAVGELRAGGLDAAERVDDEHPRPADDAAGPAIGGVERHARAGLTRRLQ